MRRTVVLAFVYVITRRLRDDRAQDNNLSEQRMKGIKLIDSLLIIRPRVPSVSFTFADHYESLADNTRSGH